MDFRKFRFEERKKEKEQKKKLVEKRRMDEIKEIRTGSRTEWKDLEMKADMAAKLLEKGHRVKLSVVFRSGDRQRGVGVDLLQKMIDKIGDACNVESAPRDESHRSWALVKPAKLVSKPSPKQQDKNTNIDADKITTAELS